MLEKVGDRDFAGFPGNEVVYGGTGDAGKMRKRWTSGNGGLVHVDG